MSGNFLRSSCRLTSSIRSASAGSQLFKCKHEPSRNFHVSGKRWCPTSILMPSLSPTMTEGAIKQWTKQEGDAVKAGDVLMVLETDKADMEMEADEDGVLAKILVPAGTGSMVKVGQLIAVMAEEGEDWRNVEVPVVDSPSEPAASPSQAQPPSADTPGQGESRSSLLGPSVRKLLEEYGTRVEDIKPSGPHGTVLKGDVLKWISSQNLTKVTPSAPVASPADQAIPPPAVSTPSKPVPRPGETFVDLPHSNMRKTIAKRLTNSKSTVPHTYANIACDVRKLSDLRNQLLGDDIKVSMNDFIIKAAGIALQRNPRVNSVWQGETTQISNTVDISVAVATPNGLITPIVKDAAFLGVEEISATVKEMAGRARQGKLQPHEYQGGSFSISNLGMFGVHEFTAVINPPQCAILAVGTSRVEPGLEGEARVVMTVQLSYDGRVIDHTEASQFLDTFRALIETPSLMLSGIVPQQAAAV